MTDFYRNGHFRTTANGTTSWVNGHSVSRNHWAGGGSSLNLSATLEVKSFALKGLKNPIPLDLWAPKNQVFNARCPVCKQPVYFYQDSNGSAVFFDDLGPPWGKHPCTQAGQPLSISENQPLPARKTEKWRVSGWLRIWSLEYFREKENFFARGYSKGMIVQFSLENITASLLRDIENKIQTIWHYHPEIDKDGMQRAFVYTAADSAYEIQIKSVPATPPAKLDPTVPPLSRAKDVVPRGGQPARFSSTRFLSNPNASCPICGRPIYHFITDTLRELVFDEVGPPWRQHKCEKTLVIVENKLIIQKYQKWRRLLFRRFLPAPAGVLIISGVSAGKSKNITIENITREEIIKITSARLCLLHLNQTDEFEQTIGIYIPGDEYFEFTCKDESSE